MGRSEPLRLGGPFLNSFRCLLLLTTETWSHRALQALIQVSFVSLYLRGVKPLWLCVLVAEEVGSMRKELALSLAASVVMHVLLFVCFPGGRYEEHRETKETRMRWEYPVILLHIPRKVEAVREPLPMVSDSQYVQQEVEMEAPPSKIEEEAPVESLVRLRKEPFLSALDSLRMVAIREDLQMRPAVADSAEQRRLRIKRNFEEIKKGIVAWKKGKGRLPSSRYEEMLTDRGGARIGGGVGVSGLPTNWEELKQAGRRASLAGKAFASKKGVEAIFELNALELNIMAAVWTLERATPRDVYWKVATGHRASYTDIARAMEELALRWKMLWKMGKGVYASAVRREDVVHFLGRAYIQEGKRDRSCSEILVKILEALEP